MRLRGSKIGKERMGRRRAQQNRDYVLGAAMLDELRDDQIEYVRHLLRSWRAFGRFRHYSLTENNAHIPICRHAIRRALRDRP